MRTDYICALSFFYDILCLVYQPEGEKLMNKKLAPFILGIGLVSLAACNNDSGNSDEEKSESTGSETVEYGDVLANSKAGEVTTDDVLNQIGTNQVANQTFQLVLDKVLEDKYKDDINKDELNETVNKEIEQYGGEENFQMMLQQSQPGMTVDAYKSQRVSNAYNDLYFADYFEITDEKAFDSVRKGSHILVAFSEDGEDEDALTKEEAKKKADDLKAQLDDGADFGELAKENSDDTGSAQKNGELGFVSKGEMVEEFETKLFELEAGEISEPVESQFGYHIILREDASLEDASEEEIQSIKTKLVNQKIQEEPQEALQAYKDLMEEYEVSFENEEIDSYIEETFLNADEALENAKKEDPAAEEEDAGAPKEDANNKDSEEDAEEDAE